jgi:hypothetical protein
MLITENLRLGPNMFTYIPITFLLNFTLEILGTYL